MSLSTDPGVDQRRQLPDLIALNWRDSNSALALNRNQDALLGSPAAALVFEAVLKPGLCPEIFFIHLHDAVEDGSHLATLIHHGADTMPQIPCRGLSNPQPPSQHHRGNALAGVDDLVHGLQPLPQQQLGALQRGIGGYRKLPLAAVTLINPSS